MSIKTHLAHLEHPHNVLMFAVLAPAFFVIPYLYEERMVGGIFRNDFYLLWSLGIFAWLFALHQVRNVNQRTLLLVGSGLLFLVVSYLVQSKGNADSLYAVITFFSLVGLILFYLKLNATCLKITLIAILASLCWQIAIGYSQVIQYAGSSLNVTGLMHNSGYFANYLLAAAPLSLAMILYVNHSKIFKLVATILFCSLMGLVILSLARAAWIGLLVGILAVTHRSTMGLIRQNRVIFFVGISVILPLLSYLLFWLKPGSSFGRLTIFRVSLQIFQDHSIFGVGPNQFAAHYNNFQADYHRNRDIPIDKQLLADNTFEAFNFIIQLLVEYGLAGLAVFVAFCYFIIRRTVSPKNARENAVFIGSVGSLLALFASSMFSNPFHMTPILLVLPVFLSVIFKNIKQNGIRIGFSTECRLFIWLLISTCIIPVIYKNQQAELLWYQAAKLAKFGNYRQAKPLYEGAYPVLRNHSRFLFNYGSEALLNGDSNSALASLQAAKRYNSFNTLYIFLGDAYLSKGQYLTAERHYLNAVYMVPSHIYPKYQLIQLYRKWGDQKSADFWLNKTLAFPLKIKNGVSEEYLQKLWIQR